MRRVLLVFALLVFGGLLAPSATAHGSCSSLAFTPTKGGGAVQFRSQYDCHGTVHSTITTAVGGWRRTPGQAWTQVFGKGASASNKALLGVSGTVTFDCHKDYTTTASGSASPGGHSGQDPSSGVLTHSC